jgi:hypothetical protein
VKSVAFLSPANEDVLSADFAVEAIQLSLEALHFQILELLGLRKLVRS